jgi:radical SAM superfamily enzyme YgiQ (UPF0313 family)
VLKGMEIMNCANWFPMCTFIIGLPGETDADVRESLDSLYVLKDAKWCVIPTFSFRWKILACNRKKAPG